MKKVSSVAKEKSVKTETVKKAAAKAEPVKVVEAKQEKAVEAVKAEPVEEKKTVAKKTVAKKPAVKKTVEKKAAAVKEEIFVQVNNQEILTTDIVNRVKAAFAAEGHAADSVKKVRVYIKPEENMIYYVVNDDYASGISLF